MMIDFKYLFPKYGINPYGVLHLGASTGQERDVYKELGVKEVIWVEAIPGVFNDLCYNIKDYPGHSAICACVGDEEGKGVIFNVSNNEAQSSSYLELGHHKIIHPEVHYVRSFPVEMRRGGVLFKDVKFENDWLLNADLQGAELQAFI